MKIDAIRKVAMLEESMQRAREYQSKDRYPEALGTVMAALQIAINHIQVYEVEFAPEDQQ